MKKRDEKLKVSSVATLKVYAVQSTRIKDMVRKGRLCEEKIVFLSGAFATLLKDENFVNLIAMEQSGRIPKCFQEWIAAMERDTS
jgi:hypothetical protein